MRKKFYEIDDEEKYKFKGKEKLPRRDKENQHSVKPEEIYEKNMIWKQEVNSKV